MREAVAVKLLFLKRDVPASASGTGINQSNERKAVRL
jgi:hypothetical protein